MRKYVCLFVFAITPVFIFCQANELNAVFNSGFFSYRNSQTFYPNQVNIGGIPYTNNVTSAQSAFSFGASFTAQRITRYGLILGADVGVESLATQQSISRTYDPYNGRYDAATGKTVFRRQFINSFLFIGYAGTVKKIRLGLKAGFDFAQSIGADSDKGTVVMAANDSTLKVNRQVHGADRKGDVRFRAQLDATKGRYGIYAGYSLGVANYFSGILGGGNPEAYMQYIRLGISYRVLKTRNKR